MLLPPFGLFTCRECHRTIFCFILCVIFCYRHLFLSEHKSVVFFLGQLISGLSNVSTS